MITRTLPLPVFLAGELDMLSQYKAPGVTISAAEDGRHLLVTAPDDAAADAAEVWLAEMDTPGH